MTARPTVAIVGAGVIGLSVGWRLAQAGCAVDVFDRGEAGRGASWAAAGMLAACVEAEPGEEKLLALNRRSQELWPGFAAALEAASGLPVGYRREGTLVAAMNRDDAERLRADHRFQRSLGLPTQWLNGAETRQREGHLASGVIGAVYAAEDHQVDNRQVVHALAAALAKAGGRLHENVRDLALDCRGGQVAAIEHADGRHAADVVVVAAGPWSRAIAGLPDDAKPPVRPIKGQMLALAMDPTAPLLRHVLWAPRVYLVPRNDGRLLVGATVEERGFDPSLTAGGTLALLEAAWRAIPAIEELAISEMWSGFRPGSPDDAPILGPTSVDGLVIATGHHRNGILLTPVTAEAIADFVLHGRLADVAQPFTLSRLAPAMRENATCLPVFE
jgi:glycine oxidase